MVSAVGRRDHQTPPGWVISQLLWNEHSRPLGSELVRSHHRISSTSHLALLQPLVTTSTAGVGWACHPRARGLSRSRTRSRVSLWAGVRGDKLRKVSPDQQKGWWYRGLRRCSRAGHRVHLEGVFLVNAE